MKLHVFHRTRYVYGAPVRESFNEARLQPVSDGRQLCHHFELNVQPGPSLLVYADFYRNTVHQFEVPQFHSELVVDANSVVSTAPAPTLTPDALVGPCGETDAHFQNERCFEYLQPSTYVDVTGELADLARSACRGGTDAWQVAQGLMNYVHGEFHYQPASTNSHTHMREVLATKAGVCQDFAHVMLGLCRALSLPARYVSGYLYNGPAETLKGAQASHAWVEAYIPYHGWIGFDPTNNHVVSGNHVKVAVGRDYADVPPVKGTYRGTGRRSMTIEVLVSRAEEPAYSYT